MLTLSHPGKEQTCMSISGYQQDFSMRGRRVGFLSPKAASDYQDTVGAGKKMANKENGLAEEENSQSHLPGLCLLRG